MKKNSIAVLVISIFALSSCVTSNVPPGQAKKVNNPPPGQMKKATGSQSAAPYAPGQQNKSAAKKKH